MKKLTRRTFLSTVSVASMATGVAGMATGLAGCSGGANRPAPIGTPTPTPSSTPTPIPTPGPTPVPTPSPSPGGTRTERFGFVEIEAGKAYIGSVRTDGSDYRRVAIPGQLNITVLDWSPDGRRVAFQVDIDNQRNHNIYIVNADGTGLRFFHQGWYPKWHPDSQHLACTIYSVEPHNNSPEQDIVGRVYGENVDTGALAVIAPYGPVYLPFFNGERHAYQLQRVAPQWLSASSHDLLVTEVYSGTRVSETRIVQYSAGLALYEGRVNIDTLTGEIYTLGKVAADGTYTFSKKTVSPDSISGVAQPFIVRNGVIEPQDPAFREEGLRLFSPDSARCLVNLGVQMAIVPVGGTTRTPVAVPANVSTWFYE